MGYSSKGCREIRNKVDKQFYATKTVVNNIYQPCYNQKISSTQKYVLQGRRMKNMIGEFQTCEDLKGIYHFFNQPLIFRELHVDPIRY